jgi:DNA-binding MarR family transcriptional regulator
VTEANIGERHLQLLRVLDKLGGDDPADAVFMHRAAQEIGLDTVGKEEHRREYTSLARDLEEAGYVEVQGTPGAANYGLLSITEEGQRKIEKG